MPRQIWTVLLAMLVTSFCAFGDSAASLWTTTPGTGTISYEPGTGPGGTDNSLETTTAIGVSTVEALNSFGVSIPPGFTITDGALTFETDTPGPTPGTLTSWQWGGGTLEITGCIAGVTGTGVGGACTAANDTSVLVDDSFTSVVIDPAMTIGTHTAPGFIFGNLTGQIVPSSLVTALGLTTGYFGPRSSADIVLADTGAHKLPTTIGSSFTSVSTDGGQGAPSGTLDLVAGEYWSPYNTLAVFGLGLAAFVGARRFGLIKSTVF
jgi:hypothetical protein